MRVNPDAREGEYAVISVSDTGSGMPEEVLKQAFDPFFTTKPKGKGVGLGLSMAYGFVTQSGGHIRMNSETGQGAQVWLYLPRLLESQNELSSSKTHSALGGDETILVVEDNLAVQEIGVARLT